MSTLTCPHCQKTLRTKAPIEAGRKIKCPACEKVFQAPELAVKAASRRPVEAAAGARAASGPAASNRPARRKQPVLDELDDERPVRRSKKKKTASGPNVRLLAICGVGLLVAGVAMAGFVWPGFLVDRKAPSTAAAPAQPGGDRQQEERPQQERRQKQIAKEPSNGAMSLRAIMVRLTKGPESLGSTIGDELKVDAPAWESLQEQTKEYFELAKSMIAQDPPRGSKDSWTALTASFAETAQTLDQSVQAKNKDAALMAHESLSNSCMACHREHRGGGPKGFGGKGGFGQKKGLRPDSQP